jgi:hypothetical protein
MGDGDPPQHLRELPITPRPEEEMPVIRHQAIGCDAYPGLGVGLSQNLLKRGVVSGFLKQWESSDSAVEDMIGEVTSNEARAAGHGRCSTETVTILSRKDSRPLFFSLFFSFFFSARKNAAAGDKF